MKYLKNFNEKMLTYLDQDVNIRIDLEASRHATDRFFRHGFEEKIEEGDIIDIVERSIEELTIAMMQNKLNIDEPFIIKDAYSDLHLVAVIQSGSNEFKMKIITLMRKEGFKGRDNQFFIEI